ncbi:MAG: hypothetical protein O3A28_01000 [Actinomycetota bacterium]|nr:hypothetical protein [Actinomycetota bacterium]MDA3006376.1 hypothetical protein [Actinomycetota bacterium]MDA3033590.1 hypothetical protein [Actinomycetota bacterium]
MHSSVAVPLTTTVAVVAAAATAHAINAPRPVIVAMVGVAAVNAVVSAVRGVYDITCSRGLIALIVDSTWAVVMTAAAVVAHGVAAAMAMMGRSPGFDATASRGSTMHIYRRGLVVRGGYAITLGNVVSGAGDMSAQSRHALVWDHERVHVAQARWWGPAYPVLYLAWMLWGTVRAGVCWAASGGRGGWSALVRSVDTAAYLRNPFERQAYRIAAQRAAQRDGVTSSPAGQTSPD